MLRLETLAALAVLGLANAQSTVGFGPYFSLGPTQSWIREATTTLVLPEVPSPVADRLALWPGMGTSGGDLIQALAVSFSDPNANCGGTSGQWCIWASTLEGTQLGGTQVPANAGDKVTMEYKYNDSTAKYDQTVSLNGKVVSTLSTSSGQAQGWGTAVECQDDACKSTARAHRNFPRPIISNFQKKSNQGAEYIDTTIVLNAADSTFAGTLATNEITSTGLKTSDSKTFTVETINVQAHTYDL